ncbi:MAG: triple tyrosine motif-containing protein [Bacteroidales bacterium]|nr:triple tyrosine motif-containing protein [Bacteroidales bacterium]
MKRIGIPFIRNYYPAEIPSGAQTWMIDISKDGLAYFANNDGVMEFDGLYWRTYPLPGGIVVRCVHTASDGRIYAGGFNQIGYFITDEGGLMRYKSLSELVPKTNQNFGEVWKIHELPYGIVFQSYKQLMIYSNGGVNILKAPESFHFSFLVNSELYINDQQEGLFRLAHDRLVKIPGVDLLKGQLIWAMIAKGNNILIATADMGIFEFNGYQLTEWASPNTDFFKNNQVYCGMAISDDTYAFGTIQDGLVLCDSSGTILQHINIDKGLQNNTVLSIQIDQYGNLWLGLDNGIDYVEINSPLTYFTDYSNLSAGYAAVLHDGLLYLATNRGVFYQDWEKLQTNAAEQSFAIVPGTQGQAWDFKVVDGTLFCGHNSGIFTIDGTQATKISEVQGGWTFIQPEDRDDLLICGTYTYLVKFENVDGKWVDRGKIKGFMESSRFLVNAGPQKIWMSHGYLGVFRIHFNEAYDSVTKIEIYNSNNGLPSDENINVFEVFNKAVFTTEKGFYEYDVRTNSFIPDEMMRNIFPQESIQKIHRDETGNIWYFTMNNAGVYRLQEDGTYFNLDVPFRELEGRFIKYFQFVYPLNEDHVIFGIQDGFVHYSPKFPKNYQHGLTSFIRKTILVSLDSTIYQSGKTEMTISTPIPYKFNQLRFEFTASDFENPSSMQFSTFLEGFDSEWSAWQSRPVREYTNLDHGFHTFRVKARNIFGKESNVSSVIFEILPPWYLQWWAYVIYLLVIAVFIYMMAIYVRYRMEKSKRQEKERQKRLFKEREKQLQTEALEAEKEVIRLRNEKLSADMKQKDKELANNTMQMIQKSKSLISIKKELSKLAREINDENIRHKTNLLIRKINREIDTENQWEVFESHFESVHEEFLKRLKAEFPDLTPREMKLCAYLRLNISSKEIATLMNISTRGVEISRYRLRKKLRLSHDTNLTEFIMTF